ncbi:MAG: hypothetical protein Q9206_001346 [Seirophora lacunosa]
MAAPQIPNLNTLKRGSGRPSGRGHGAPSSTSEEDHAAKDKIVQQTDQDASVSRLSAVELGYLDDPFAKLFVSGNGNQRRFPIINRGSASFPPPSLSSLPKKEILEADGMFPAPKARMSAPPPSTTSSTASSPPRPPPLPGNKSSPSAPAPTRASSASARRPHLSPPSPITNSISPATPPRKSPPSPAPPPSAPSSSTTMARKNTRLPRT